MPEASHYAGRHRVRASPTRRPPALRRASVLPTVTAAALVATAAAATLVQQVVLDPPPAQASAAPASLHLSVQQVVTVRAEEADETSGVADLAVRRRAVTLQAAATRGQVETRQRAVDAVRRRAAAEQASRARQARTQRADRAKKLAAAKVARAEQAAARARAVRESHRWVRAITTGRLTSDFGPRWGRTHDGLDIGAPIGTPVHAMSRGTVVLAHRVPSFGNKVEIRYWNGTVSWYGHLSRIGVREGQVVAPGDVVGAVGNTGHSFGPHLHIEIHPTGGDHPVDPAPWLRAKGIRIG
jgi:murein DD-endopeptidase MepM/ murein hydrolase activator NlpD